MNKESTWGECIETNSSLKVIPNRQKVKSLIDIATGRIQFLSESSLKDSNANYLFENYYSSVLELMHALVLIHGYKVSNHICLGYYLRDIMKNEELYRLFDDCRTKRNFLVYYGRKMDFETAKQSIEKCNRLIIELNILLKQENKKSQSQQAAGYLIS